MKRTVQITVFGFYRRVGVNQKLDAAQFGVSPLGGFLVLGLHALPLLACRSPHVSKGGIGSSGSVVMRVYCIALAYELAFA
ncbi:MAG: hypothetical protein ACRD6X_22170 [Pyrinomonadaceae bacterium]